jgi:DNA polymerase-1
MALTELGWIDGKRYVWDPKSQSVCWSVPAEREAVRAGPGRKLVISDFSQIEVRLIAFLAQESALINAINAKRDTHCHMVSLIYRVAYDLVFEAVKNKKHPQHEEYAQKRAGVKTVTFGIPYGAGPRRVAKMIQLKDKAGNAMESMEDAIERARELIDEYFLVAPNIYVWLEQMREMAQTKGYTETVNGRRRFYEIPPVGHPEYEKLMSQIGRWAGNMPVQGSSADILKDAMQRLYCAHRGDDHLSEKIVRNRFGKVLDANILLVAHDEIVTDAADKDVERGEEMLVRSMSDAYNAVSMTKVLANGTTKTFYLKDIYNKVDAIVSDFWSKD